MEAPEEGVMPEGTRGVEAARVGRESATRSRSISAAMAPRVEEAGVSGTRRRPS